MSYEFASEAGAVFAPYVKNGEGAGAELDGDWRVAIGHWRRLVKRKIGDDVTLFVLIPVRYLVRQLVSRPRQTFIRSFVTPQMRYQRKVHHHAMFISHHIHILSLSFR